MLYIFSLVMAPFAVYRIATMIALEEGPFEIFTKFRNLFLSPNWIGRGVRCPSCISFWAGLVMAIVVFLFGSYELVQLGILWFGFSGITVYLINRR